MSNLRQIYKGKSTKTSCSADLHIYWKLFKKFHGRCWFHVKEQAERKSRSSSLLTMKVDTEVSRDGRGLVNPCCGVVAPLMKPNEQVKHVTEVEVCGVKFDASWKKPEMILLERAIPSRKIYATVVCEVHF